MELCLGLGRMMGSLFVGAVPRPGTPAAKHEHLQEMICLALLLGWDLKFSPCQSSW